MDGTHQVWGGWGGKYTVQVTPSREFNTTHRCNRDHITPAFRINNNSATLQNDLAFAMAEPHNHIRVGAGADAAPCMENGLTHPIFQR